MTAKSRTTLVVTGVLGVAAAAGVVAMTRGRRDEPKPVAEAATTALAPDGPLKALAAGLERGDVPTLAELARRIEAKPEGAPKPPSEAEAADYSGVISALRSGYLKFSGTAARTTAIASSVHILEKFAVEPAPPGWIMTLTPIRDLLDSGMNEAVPDLRAGALAATGRIWNWYPGRAMQPIEEKILGEWKDAIHSAVVRQLAQRDAKTRAAAVASLALTPTDSLAAPAVAYADDPQSGDVRNQVLVSFARRSNLLTEDMILKRLHDHEPGIPQLAELILQTRGLSKDQVALGRLISSPKVEMRASVIPLLRDHADLDPVVWLLRLSHDPEETVRAKAVEAMNGKDSAELRSRLREMADGDASEAVRASARALVARFGPAETTASLPPLPGSPSLTPKAN